MTDTEQPPGDVEQLIESLVGETVTHEDYLHLGNLCSEWHMAVSDDDAEFSKVVDRTDVVEDGAMMLRGETLTRSHSRIMCGVLRGEVSLSEGRDRLPMPKPSDYPSYDDEVGQALEQLLRVIDGRANDAERANYGANVSQEDDQ